MKILTGWLLFILIPAALVQAEERVYKTEEIRRIEAEFREVVSSGGSLLPFCQDRLQSEKVSREGKQSILSQLVEISPVGAETSLLSLGEQVRQADPWLYNELRRAALRVQISRCTSVEKELELLGLAATVELESNSSDSLGQWLALEICSRGGGEYLRAAKSLIRRVFSSERTDVRIAFCGLQVALLSKHSDPLDAFEEALTTEDNLPEVSVHKWALESLAEVVDPRADSILLEYALRLQEGDWPLARNIIEVLQERGWSAAELEDLGWHSEPPAVRALRSGKAVSTNEDN